MALCRAGHRDRNCDRRDGLGCNCFDFELRWKNHVESWCVDESWNSLVCR